MTLVDRRLAVITGASSGIGRELARCCAEDGFDLVIAADEPEIDDAAEELRQLARGTRIDPLEADLATPEGVDRIFDVVGVRPVDVLIANAGRGLGYAFVDQDFGDVERVIDTNITGTLYLLQRVARTMRSVGHGRILITGSIAGFIPGTYQGVYNGTKAFLDSFSFALRQELSASGVTVTCLMPGPTDTEFFARAGMLDTKLGQGEKDDPAEVARRGYDAMMRGDGEVVTGWQNKLRTALAHLTPADLLARIHGRMAEPGSGRVESS
jgi:short-subunit dehydrogenase